MEYKIFNHCRRLGCCLRCSSRFCGQFLASNLSGKVMYWEDQHPSNDFNQCRVCLGILQDQFSSVLTKEVMNKVDVVNLNVGIVSYILHIPLAVLIREKAMSMYLSTYCNSQIAMCYSVVRGTSVKNELKNLLQLRLEHLSNEGAETTGSCSQIDILMSYPHDEKECNRLWIDYNNSFGVQVNQIPKDIKNKIKDLVDSDLSSTTKQVLKGALVIPPCPPQANVLLDNVTFRQGNLFIGGRYAKFSRRLCQTPWFIQGKQIIDGSVQDTICNSLTKYVKADAMKFSSSGREDVDVRMLAPGRPFAVEFVNPRITRTLQNELKNIVDDINKSTQKVQIIDNLKILSTDDVQKLREGEHSKSKTYRALCIHEKVPDSSLLISKLNSIGHLDVHQKTPLRVLHRRSFSSRKRSIYELRARLPYQQELERYKSILKKQQHLYSFIVLDVKTQAGTYVKEFVHGDYGRTTPNLSSLLNINIDIIALDVTGISLKWP